jgi:hypothetical protein
MPETPSAPDHPSQPAPSASTDLPSSFEPAFRAVQVLFQTRLREARSRIDQMDQGWEQAYKEYSDARMDYARRMQRLFLDVGLLRATGGPVADRSGLVELLDGMGTPEARALVTDMHLEDEWKRRGEPEDKELEKVGDDIIWAVDEQILGREGLFEPQTRQQMLQECRQLRADTDKLGALRSRMATEMRRMILFSMRERDFKELDALFKKRKYYLSTQAAPEAAGKKDRRGSSPHGGAIRLAESSGRIMELLADMGTVRAGPEQFKKEATKRMCADIEEVVFQMDAIILEAAAIR